MLNESAEKVSGKISSKLICESCGAEFSCGANVGECWCFAVMVEKKTLADVRDNFNNCLCENCLSSAKVKFNGKFIYTER